MHASGSPGDDGRPDPPTVPPGRAGDGGLARWEAQRAETIAAYDDHRRRFIASGGDPARFDGLHLMTAARLRARLALNVLGASQGSGTRAATEEEIRTTLASMADEAIEARGRGRFRAFRRMLWPFGPPSG